MSGPGDILVLDQDLQQQLAATMARLQAVQAQRNAEREKRLPKGMYHHAVSNGLVKPPARKPSKRQQELDNSIDIFGLRK